MWYGLEAFGLFVISGLAGLGLMLLGTRFLSEGLQLILSPSIRSTMRKLGEGKRQAVLIGFTTTFMIQSRISASVMALSFANSGLMSHRQLILFLSGTALGTVFFPFIFLLEVGRLDLVLLAVGILPLLYAKTDELAGFGRCFFAVGLLLLGFDIVAFGSSRPDEILALTQSWDLGALSCVVIAAAMMLAFRSTVALLGALMALSAAGVVSNQVIILATIGINLGAVFLTMWNSRDGNETAKRGVGVFLLSYLVLALLLVLNLPIYMGALEFWANELSIWASAKSLMFSSMVLAPALHLALNVAAVGILFMVSLALPNGVDWFSFSKKKKQPHRLQYSGRPSHLAPSLALEHASQEVKKLAAMVHSMLNLTLERSQSADNERVVKYESITDNILRELTHYVVQVTQGQLTRAQSLEAVLLLQVALELEKVADCCEELIRFFELQSVSHDIKQEIYGYLQTAGHGFDHVFPLLTDDLRQSPAAMERFAADLKNIVLQSQRFYDRMLEAGLRSKKDYDVALTAFHAIRRIVDGIQSIVDIKKRETKWENTP